MQKVPLGSSYYEGWTKYRQCMAMSWVLRFKDAPRLRRKCTLANAACSKSLRSLRSSTYGKEGTRSTRSTRASNASSVCWLTPHVHKTHSTTQWHTPKEHKQQAGRTLGRSTELDAAIPLVPVFVVTQFPGWSEVCGCSNWQQVVPDVRTFYAFRYSHFNGDNKKTGNDIIH